MAAILLATAWASGAQPVEAAFPGENGRIAFIKSDLKTGSCPKGSIWTMDADGGGERELTGGIDFGVIGGVAWSPDGRRLAFTVQTDIHAPLDVMGVLAMDADGGNMTGLVNVPVGANWRCDPGGPTWSPDGTRLAVGGVDGIYVIDLADPLSPAHITAGAPDFYDQPAWSPDGELIAVRVPAKGAIGAIPAAGGAATLLTDPMAASRPNWSPDGTRIAFETGVGAEIGILDRCHDSVTTINRGGWGEHHPVWSPDGEHIAFEIDIDDSVVYIDVPVPPDAGPEFTGRLAILAGFRSDILTSSPDRRLDASVNLTKTGGLIREAMPDWQPLGKPPSFDRCSKDLVVNSAADRADTEAGDGKCDTGRNVADTRECTLRAAIQESNKTDRPTRITFAIPEPATIRVTDQLPAVAGRSVIDGTTQDGGWVVLDGSGSPADGIRLLGSQSTVRGLVIGGFPGAGVVLGGRGAHEVVGNRIGTTADGMAAAPNGVGVRVTGGDVANTIGGFGLSRLACADDCNLISGNSGEGIRLEGGSGHRVTGNLIGLALDGASRLPNRVGITVHANGVEVGDDTGAPGTSPGNLVSGNSETEVWVRYRGDDTRVEGNIIGLDISGTKPAGGKVGVQVDSVLPRGDREVGGPNNVRIGGLKSGASCGGACNVIFGATAGVAIEPGPDGARVRGNHIGVSANGMAAVAEPNRAGSSGIRVAEGATKVTIGGTFPVEGNLIGGATFGVDVSADGTRIQGNRIGVALDDSTPTGVLFGVGIDQADDVLVGGLSDPFGEPPGNRIIARWLGVQLLEGERNIVAGNHIEHDPTETVQGIGVEVSHDATEVSKAARDNSIGHDELGGNRIIGFAGGTGAGHGITITRADRTTISRNVIGVDSDGQTARPNKIGIYVIAAPETRIRDNVVSGNELALSISSIDVEVVGNRIGTDPTGMFAIPNERGIVARGEVTIGGLQGSDDDPFVCDGYCNLISGNADLGVDLGGEATLERNFIGTDITGTAPIPNGVGVEAVSATGVIGGPDSAQGNIVAYNGRTGLLVLSTSAMRIMNNRIHSNGLLGIDLSEGGALQDDGPTPNDILDEDDGPNGLRNYPEIRSVTVDGNVKTVSGDVATSGLDSYVVDVFANRECDESGFGEAEMLVASTTASVGGDFEVSFPTTPERPFVTATVTGPEGTSEISECFGLAVDPDP